MVQTDELVREPVGPDAPSQEPEEGVAIALSGGGYRAMLFHTGALLRMGELGFFGTTPLQRTEPHTGKLVSVGPVSRISSVSGGSLISALFGLHYDALAGLSGPDFTSAYAQRVMEPIRKLAGTTLAGPSLYGAWQVIKDMLLPGRVSARIAGRFDDILYHGKTLQDLTQAVRFVINASNLQSGALMRFSRPYLWDWKVGKIDQPTIPLAVAVGASAAFPPVLAPAVLSFNNADFVPGSGQPAMMKPPFTTRPELADGGVYDNLGLETCFKRYRTLLVSNAGKPFESQETIASNWVSIAKRCLDVMDNQVLAQRKRQLMAALVAQQRYGAFWDIQQDISLHPCPGQLPCPGSRTAALAHVDTDLATKTPELQMRLINWGYANADAAIRTWFNRNLPAPKDFPFPAAQV